MSVAKDFTPANIFTGQIVAISTSFGLHGLLLLGVLPHLNLYPKPVNLNVPVRVVELNAADLKRLPQPSPPPSLNPRFSLKPIPTPSNAFPTVPPAPPSLTLPAVPPEPPSFTGRSESPSLGLPPLPPGGSLPTSPPSITIASGRLPSSQPPLTNPYPFIPSDPPRLNIPSPPTPQIRSPLDPSMPPNMSEEEYKIRQRLIASLGHDDKPADIHYGDRGRGTRSPGPTASNPTPIATAPIAKDPNNRSKLTGNGDLAAAVRGGNGSNPQPNDISDPNNRNVAFVDAYDAMFKNFKSVYPDLEAGQLPVGTLYPTEACANKLEGKAVVGVVVKPEGTVAATPKLLVPTGSQVLDSAAVNAVTDVAFSRTTTYKLYWLTVDFKYDGKICNAGGSGGQTQPPSPSPQPSTEPSQSPPVSPQPSTKPSQSPPVSPQPSTKPSQSPSPLPQPSTKPSQSPPVSPEPTPATEQSPPVSPEPTPAAEQSPPASPESTPATEQSPPVSPEPTPAAEQSPPVSPEPTPAAEQSPPVSPEPEPSPATSPQ